MIKTQWSVTVKDNTQHDLMFTSVHLKFVIIYEVNPFLSMGLGIVSELVGQPRDSTDLQTTKALSWLLTGYEWSSCPMHHMLIIFLGTATFFDLDPFTALYELMLLNRQFSIQYYRGHTVYDTSWLTHKRLMRPNPLWLNSVNNRLVLSLSTQRLFF